MQMQDRNVFCQLVGAELVACDALAAKQQRAQAEIDKVHSSKLADLVEQVERKEEMTQHIGKIAAEAKKAVDEKETALLEVEKLKPRSKLGGFRSVQKDRTDHTNLFHRSFTGFGATRHQKAIVV